MDNFNDLIRQNSDYKKKREENFKQDSKERLAKILKKKIQTTMIGALSSMEEHFGFLWGQGELDSNLTKEQQIMKDLFQEVRSEVLDKGNTQSRNIDAELAQYEVEWKRYSLKLPVRPVRPEDKNE